MSAAWAHSPYVNETAANETAADKPAPAAMQIDCPFCGPRRIEEYQFRRTVPEPGVSAFAAVYERVNHADHSVEYWQHTGGCRIWLVVERDPSTALVKSVRQLGLSR